jgi:hypothetical protein
LSFELPRVVLLEDHSARPVPRAMEWEKADPDRAFGPARRVSSGFGTTLAFTSSVDAVFRHLNRGGPASTADREEPAEMKKPIGVALAASLLALGGITGCGEESKVKETTEVTTPGGSSEVTRETKVEKSGENPPPVNP